MQTLKLSVEKDTLSEMQKFVSDKVKEMNNDFVEFGGTLLGHFDGEVLRIVGFLYDDKAHSTSVLIRFSSDILRTTKTKIFEYNKSVIKATDKLYNVGTWHVHPPSCSCDYSNTDYKTIFQEKIWTQTSNPNVECARVHAIFEAIPERFAFYTIHYESDFSINQLDTFENIETLLLSCESADNQIIVKTDTGFSLVEYQNLLDIPQSQIVGFGRFAKHFKSYEDFDKIFLTNFFIHSKIEHKILYCVIYKESNVCDFFEVSPTTIDYTEPLHNVTYKSIETQVVENKKTLSVTNPYDTTQTFETDVNNRIVSDISEEVKKNFNLLNNCSFYTFLDYDYVVFLNGLKAKNDSFIEKITYLPNDIKKVFDKLLTNTLILDNSGKFYLSDDMTLDLVQELSGDLNTIYFENTELNPTVAHKLRTHRLLLSGYDVDKLASFKVLSGGVGLLGNEIITNLAVVGVSNFIVIDYGSVDWYNIHRQQLFNKTNIYQKKVLAAKQELENFGGISVEAVSTEVPCLASKPNKDYIFSLLEILDDKIQSADIVLGLFDIKSARSVLQILCNIHNKVFITSALDASIGTVKLHRPKQDACYCCGITLQLSDGGACTLSKISTQKIIGGLASELIVDYLTKGDLPFDTYNELRYNALNHTIVKKKSGVNQQCAVCGTENLKQMNKNEYFNFIYSWLFDRHESQ
jgi:molybdopterin/thiamine biosynthesis adenylyltransferase